MVNKEKKLTIDDLIVEYMIYKTKNGYEPSFLTSEFIDFLYYFEKIMDVEDTLYEGEELFKRFFERKSEWDWNDMPHMEMVYSEEDKDYLIKSNYELSKYDLSVINTYFMDKGLGSFGEGQVKTIRDEIKKYLEDEPKRVIDESIEVEEVDLLIGKYVSIEIIKNIWDSYINVYIEYQRWPKQCEDINKYLIETDLASIINVKSIRNEIFEVYNVLSKRIAILYNQDRNLHIRSNGGSFLAQSNYNLLIQGYEKIMNSTFNEYKKSLNINFSNLTFTESHELCGVYDWYEDPDYKVTETKIGNEETKKLVKKLDENINNK